MKIDVFGNRCLFFVKDHIYPKSKGGSNWKENEQLLCPLSNQEKSDKMRGSINGLRFSIEHVGRDDYGKIIGEMDVWEK